MRFEQEIMSHQVEQETVQGRVVLDVPKPHVKTVKSALEKLGQLDRTSRITPGTTKDQAAATPPESQIDYAQDENAQEPEATFQFPVLQFGAVSGQYVEPVILPHERQRTAANYGKSIFIPGSTLDESHEEPTATFANPGLKFDVVSGQYVEPTVLQQQGQRTISSTTNDEQRMRVPTTIPYPHPEDEVEDISQEDHNHELKSKILEDLGLSHLYQDIVISHQSIPTNSKTLPPNKKPLQRALREALKALPPQNLESQGLTVGTLVSSFPDSYSVYKPMLLLPHNAFISKAWKTFLAAHTDPSSLQPVWQRIADAVGATHIAINSPIPLQTSTESTTAPQLVEPQTQENILRSPVNLTPIYGDFGPLPTAQTLSSPTAADFNNALWVTATQNGIHQTWAPFYTMFSRGNIREKTRVLNLPSAFDIPSTAVDLYAGIGYFAFSYKKSGERRENSISQVLCWELNPWSVEGLRRGAEMNKWTYKIWNEQDIPDSAAGWEAWRRELVVRKKEEEGEGTNSEDFWIFQMSNDCAGEIIHQLNNTTPDSAIVLPIRHINLGLLPSSERSWMTAVWVLDDKRGGWIHVHENVGVKDIEARTREVEITFQGLVDEWEEEKMGMGSEKVRRRRVGVGHVERVKMYAPGVVHCVFDVCISGLS